MAQSDSQGTPPQPLYATLIELLSLAATIENLPDPPDAAAKRLEEAVRAIRNRKARPLEPEENVRSVRFYWKLRTYYQYVLDADEGQADLLHPKTRSAWLETILRDHHPPLIDDVLFADVDLTADEIRGYRAAGTGAADAAALDLVEGFFGVRPSGMKKREARMRSRPAPAAWSAEMKPNREALSVLNLFFRAAGFERPVARELTVLVSAIGMALGDREEDEVRRMGKALVAATSEWHGQAAAVAYDAAEALSHD